MKYLMLTCLIFLAGMSTGYSQAKLPPPDKSPMDMCYFPSNYPILKIQNKISEPPVARVVYSRPNKNGRTVYGELVEMGQVWRLGANEATELELYREAKLGGKVLKKGRYSLFAIPQEDKWTLIVNSETDVWGAFQYNQSKDVFRLDLKPEKLQEPLESFTIAFDKDDNGIRLVFAWDDLKAEVPFSY